MDKITFITCGGTIDKDYSTAKGSYNFTFSEPAVKKILHTKEFRFGFDTEIIELMQKDSLDMEDADSILLKHTIEKSDNDKIIVTHGTDTMIASGKTLKGSAKDKVIVLVGSSLPENFKNSDATLNIGFALGCVRILAKTGRYGVYIAMNGECFDIDDVMKREDGVFQKLSL